MLYDFHEESNPPYQCVEDTLMNNKKHVGSLVICSEPRNMRIYFLRIWALFRPI